MKGEKLMQLKELTNNHKRKEWLEQYRDWPVWFTVHQADEVYYRYDLPDGCSVVVKEYKKWNDPNSWWVQNRGGDSIAYEKVYYLLTPDYHFLADCRSSETQIIEHLKKIRKVDA